MSDSAPDPMSRSYFPRKRVLVVNCYLDYSREPIRRPNKFPQSVGAIYLAGACSRELCEVRCYDELSSGPLTDASLLGWADMLVLTGLTHCFDRLLHLTAYARTKNPKVIVVAGGPAVRALPRLSEKFFDYSCLGDIEELREVITDDDRARAQRAEHDVVDERVRRQARELARERQRDHRIGAGFAE